jgi:restriction endonuclease S subunit
MLNLSARILNQTPLPYPSLPEQREIACILSVADRKVEAEEQRKAALQALFETLLHQLMTAQIRLGNEWDSPNKTTLKPLVESAIEHEKEMLSLAIRHTRERLAEFERRLNALELQETIEFTDWRMEIGTLRLLESQYQALREAQVD